MNNKSTGNLSEEQLNNLKKQIREQLANDRHALLIKFPFIGNLAMRFDLIPIRDKRCRTACTDGKAIYWDCDFFTKLTDQERVFVLAHELFHNVMLHLVRCQTRIPELFNIATDMEVNYLLEQQGGGTLFKAPKNLCFPPNSMKGKSAEVIYEWLLRKAKKNTKNQNNGKGNGMSGSGKGGSEKSQNQSGYSDEDDSSGNDGNGKHGNKTGKLEGQFDSHEYGNEDNDSQNSNSNNNDGDNNKNGNGSGGVKDQWGEVGYDKDFKPHVSGDFAEKMREAVIAEAQRTARTQGTMPAGLEGIINQICKPQFHWKEELAKFCTLCYNGKPRWTPPSRRHIYNEVYLQSHRNEKLKCTVLLDTSGSCWGDLPKFFGELIGLLKSFGQYEITLIQADADVQSVEKYDDSNPFPIDNLKKVEAYGCGGSDFRPAFKYIREHNIETNVMIAMTDGYIDVPRNPPPYPVLWVLTNDHSEDFCDYGKKMVFKPSSSDDYTSLSS